MKQMVPSHPRVKTQCPALKWWEKLMVSSLSVWHRSLTIKSFGKCGLVPIYKIGHGHFNVFSKISECLKTRSKSPNKLN